MNVRLRHRAGGERRSLWPTAALVSYALLLTAVAFWPSPVDRGIDPALESALTWLHAHGLPGVFDYAFVERSANVVLFVPLGLFVALLLPRRRWWIAALTGLAVSGAIETAQLLLLPARFATLDDVAMNTTGALLGAAASLLLLRRR
jgi:hypothetical protein